jgi:hypothetical protein
MRDLRKYAHQTNVRLIAGAILVIFIVGDGMIFIIYGKSAAVMGLLCLSAGMIPVILTFLVLAFFDWVRKRFDED